MRAVNLIPMEERRGPGAGRSGLPAFAIVGVLALMLVGVTAYVVLSNQISERRADIARKSAQVTAAEAQAARLAPYATFASLEKKRVQTVNQLAQSRFDWETTMDDLARVVTPNVWLTSFTGTVAPGVSLGASGGAGGGTSSLRSALPNPAAEISGCATSTVEVVRFVSRLRVMNGVIRVSLADSQKADGAASSGGSSGATGGCQEGSDKFPQFDLVVFFKSPPAASATAAAPGTSATPATATTPAQPAASTPAPAGSTTPVSAGGSK
jgi:Tfp pilus assembly protein PilN